MPKLSYLHLSAAVLAFPVRCQVSQWLKRGRLPGPSRSDTTAPPEIAPSYAGTADFARQTLSWVLSNSAT